MTTQTDRYKLAVVGHEGTIAIYRMLGVEAHPVGNADGAKAMIEKLMNTHKPGTEQCEYAAIFIEENFHAGLPADLVEKLTRRALPAVISVPTPASERGKKSYGVKRLRSIVERAIGSDILG